MMIVSLVIAGLGILLAYRMYIKNPALPDRLVERYETPYRTLLNKYWVDEIYHFLFVRSALWISLLFWRFVDDLIVDGIVNGWRPCSAAGAKPANASKPGTCKATRFRF